MKLAEMEHGANWHTTNWDEEFTGVINDDGYTTTVTAPSNFLSENTHIRVLQQFFDANGIEVEVI